MAKLAWSTRPCGPAWRTSSPFSMPLRVRWTLQLPATVSITIKEPTMPMKNHPHPGRIVRQDCLEPLGLTVTDAAKALGVARQTLNSLVNARAGISPEMAVRLSKAFGSSPEMWVRLQANYDLSQVRQEEIDVRQYKRASRAA